MVTASSVGQLSGECSVWRDALRSFRDQFVNFQSALLKSVSRQTNRDVLLEIEHLHNQFHIQLINIHDLKQAIKKHVLQMDLDRRHRGDISDATLVTHEYLSEEYKRLDNTLQVISDEFQQFLQYITKKE